MGRVLEISSQWKESSKYQLHPKSGQYAADGLKSNPATQAILPFVSCRLNEKYIGTAAFLFGQLNGYIWKVNVTPRFESLDKFKFYTPFL